MDWLLTAIVKPLAERVGTVTATALIGWGIAAEPAQQIALGAAAALAVGVELLVNYYRHIKGGR